MRYNILVTSLSHKVPLVKNIRKALNKLTPTGRVIGGDVDEKCIGRYFVDGFWLMPPISDLKIEELISNCKKYDISVIIPTRDGELLYFAEHRERLQAENVAVMISPAPNIKVCIDKLEFYNTLKNQSDFHVVPTSSNIDDLDATSYVAKERFGAGARNIALGVSRDKALEHARQLESPVFQPYIVGIEDSVDVYISMKGVVKGVIVRRRNVVVNGESQVTTTLHNEALERAAEVLVTELGLRYHVVLQVLIDDSGVCHFIECNCRFGGASTLSVAAGLDSFYWFLLESKGEDVSNYPFCRSACELRQIRYPEGLIIDDPGF